VIRLAIRVRRADAELVLAELLELTPGGVEEVEVGAALVEYAVYGAPGELPELPDLRAAAGDALVEVSTTVVADDWSERWRQFHRPVVVEPPQGGSSPGGWSSPGGGPGRGRGSAPRAPVPALRIRPPWEPASPRPGVREIVIDPGQAFGTGGHATTRMCVELLLELACADPGRGPVLDVGTGSGVLAIAAARLGYGPVVGVDHERESVEAARENAAVNGVAIDVRPYDLRREPLPSVEGDTPPGGSPAGGSAQGRSGAQTVVLANLVRSLLLDLARAIECPPAHLIASGLLRAEADEVARAFAQRVGLHERARRESGEWAAVWLEAGPG